jgi:hypothetical protein
MYLKNPSQEFKNSKKTKKQNQKGPTNSFSVQYGKIAVWLGSTALLARGSQLLGQEKEEKFLATDQENLRSVVH